MSRDINRQHLSLSGMNYLVRWHDSLHFEQTWELEEEEEKFQFSANQGILTVTEANGFGHRLIYEVASHIYNKHYMYLNERTIYCYIKRMNGETHVS